MILIVEISFEDVLALSQMWESPVVFRAVFLLASIVNGVSRVGPTGRSPDAIASGLLLLLVGCLVYGVTVIVLVPRVVVSPLESVAMVVTVWVPVERVAALK
jgi:hypothetical protein